MRRWLWLVALLVGCGPPEPATFAATSPARAETPAEPREAEIRFETLAGEPFPYPLVQARVRGVETWIVVDTGASHTVLDRWLLDQLGVELVEAEDAGEGHAGEKVVTYVARSPKLQIPGLAGVAPREVLSVALPVVFRELGLGGVLSPQSLVGPGEEAVVDMPARRLRIAADATAAGSAVGPAEICAVGEGAGQGVVFLIAATIEGRPARLVVDTGAAQTDLLGGSAAARVLRGRSVAGATSFTAGGAVVSRTLRGAQVVAGEQRGRVDVAIMPGAPSGACPRDGHLGLDLLQRCVLRLGARHFGASCP